MTSSERAPMTCPAATGLREKVATGLKLGMGRFPTV
jgi:hypothetical protein